MNTLYKEELEKYYNNLSIKKMPYDAFLTIPFQFQLGILLSFLESKKIYIIVSNAGVRVRQGDNRTLMYESLNQFQFTILKLYQIGIDKAINQIYNPF